MTVSVKVVRSVVSSPRAVGDVILALHLHQPRVADDVGGEDRGQFAFDASALITTSNDDHFVPVLMAGR
jgi:hypothetical protein